MIWLKNDWNGVKQQSLTQSLTTIASINVPLFTDEWQYSWGRVLKYRIQDYFSVHGL